MNYQAKNILVTGGAGFIGCNFIRYMLNKHSNLVIINLDKLTYAGSLDNTTDFYNNDHHKFIEGDICDRDLVYQLLREYKVDTVVHFAAESHVDNSISDPGVFLQTNIIGTFTLLESSRLYWLDEKRFGKDDCRFHHISTDEVYGSLDFADSAFTETSPYEPNSPYSASKAGSDHLVRAYLKTYGLPITITNCSNNYGHFQHKEKFIPTIIRSCIKQKSIPVYGDGSNIRDWLYVDDHCSGIEAVLRSGKIGEVYNIGGGNEYSNIDVVYLICKLMDEINNNNAPHKKLISYVTDRLGHDLRYAINAQKIASEIKWEPVETFETGIDKTLKWYLDN